MRYVYYTYHVNIELMSLNDSIYTRRRMTRVDVCQAFISYRKVNKEFNKKKRQCKRIVHFPYINVVLYLFAQVITLEFRNAVLI